MFIETPNTTKRLIIVPALNDNQLAIIKERLSAKGCFLGEVVHFTPEDSIICVASMSDEFYQDSVPDEEVLQLLRDLEIEFKCNVWLKPFLKLEEPFLFVFDLDSTLIKLETIDELAKFAGAEEQIKVHLHTHS